MLGKTTDNNFNVLGNRALIEELIAGSLSAQTLTVSANTVVHDIKVSDLTFATSNISVGDDNLDNLTTGTNNIALGQSSQKNVTTGTKNISIGTDSLKALQTNGGNIAIGQSTLRDNIGADNTVVGRESFAANTYGSDNVVIGALSAQASQNLNRCVIVGKSSCNSANQLSNYISIGAGINPSNPQSNTCIIGDSFITSTSLGGGTFTVPEQVNCKAVKTTDTSGNTILSNQVYAGQTNATILGSQANNTCAYSNVIAVGKDSVAQITENNMCVIGNGTIDKTKIYGDVYPQQKIITSLDGIQFADSSTLKSCRLIIAPQSIHLSGVPLNNGTSLSDLPTRVNQTTNLWFDSQIRQTNPTTPMASYMIRIELTMSITDDQYPSGTLASSNYVAGYGLYDLTVNFVNQVIVVNPISYSRNLLAYCAFRTGGFTPFVFTYVNRDHIQVAINLPSQSNTTTQRISSYLYSARIVSSSNPRNSQLFIPDMNNAATTTLNGTAYFSDYVM